MLDSKNSGFLQLM